ncbi:Protein FAR1-RELATED SEQUENCE 5 [Linum grandiflorum]
MALEQHKQFCNRHIPQIYKTMADVHMAARIKPRSSFDSMRIAAGDRELGFTYMDLRNHIQRTKNKLIERGAVDFLLQYFTDKGNGNSGFYHKMKTDKDGQIESVFWDDARMRMDYQYFGDCISFDTTCRTNKKARPLGM